MFSCDREKELKEFVKTLGIENVELELLDVALTHPSFNFEVNIEDGLDYERLEFLGDSVLRLSISEFLFDKYLDFDEGKLTKIRSYLVSDEFLSGIALQIELNKVLNIGVHEEKDKGRTKTSILACAMEAVFGAVFKSCGFEVAKKFVLGLFEKQDFDIQKILYMYNSKELLQQYTQSINKDLPNYKLVAEMGKAHDKTYIIAAEYQGKELGRGISKTKKEAEKIAAYNALVSLKIVSENFNE